MHFHLPKPLHGWRAFVGEVGIIVIGVLIALGAEQLAEHWRDRAALHEAEGAMSSELRDDDFPQAFVRAAVFDCYADRLDAIDKAIAGGDRATVASVAAAYRPLWRTWDDEAWKAARDSQVLVHAGSKGMIEWSSAYIPISSLSMTGQAEQDGLAQLTPNFTGAGRLSADQQDHLSEAVSTLREYNRKMAFASLVLMSIAEERGLEMPAATKADILAEARRRFGACVRQPNPQMVSTHSQFSNLTDADLGRH